MDAKSNFLLLEKSASGFLENSQGVDAISLIRDNRLLFTRSANIISVTSKIEYIQEASPQIFLCLSSAFLKKVTKKEQGIYFYIPCSVRNSLANVLTK